MASLGAVDSTAFDPAADSASFSAEEMRTIALLMQMGIDTDHIIGLERGARLKLIDAHLTVLNGKAKAEQEIDRLRQALTSSQGETSATREEGLLAVRLWKGRFVRLSVGVGLTVIAGGAVYIATRP